MKADDTIDKYKARLVIKGYRQREGLDYFDTYSPVTRITSIRMVLAITAMDVKTAFLNRDLEEEIYMNQPEGTRPDLSYVGSRLSRYTSNPSIAHWKAMTRISDIKDSRSTNRYVFTLGGVAISWKSSKQTVIAKSTMESEFIALDKCGEEAKWLRQFVKDIPRWPKPVTAISIHYDSQSTIGRAHSTMYNGKFRHILH
ncbi:DNA polymerase zeta catalytic subunit-like protein [Tanacetum coccineum]